MTFASVLGNVVCVHLGNHFGNDLAKKVNILGIIMWAMIWAMAFDTEWVTFVVK